MKSNVLKISIIAIMLVLVYTTVVSAFSFTPSMTPSSTTVPEATEFTIEVKVSNLDVGDNGINTMSGVLEYDDTIFEKISTSSIEGLNSWNPTYNAETGKVTLTKLEFVKQEEKVFQVTFKTKADVSGKSGEIKLVDIMAANNSSEINAQDISTTITDGQTSSNYGNTTNTNSAQIPGTTTGDGNQNTNNNTNNPTVTVTPGTTNTNKNTNTNTNTNTNKAANTNTNKAANTNNNSLSSYVNGYNQNSDGEDIPYTGVEDTIMYLMIAVMLVAIVSYVKFERVNKEIK